MAAVTQRLFDLFRTAVYLIPATGVFVLLFSGFVVYFGAILKYMQWLYDTAGKPTVVAIMALRFTVQRSGDSNIGSVVRWFENEGMGPCKITIPDPMIQLFCFVSSSWLI